MALQLTRGVPSLEEKVTVLASWVSAHAAYSTQAAAYPLGEDIATYFVNHGGEAYCDVFATVFTIMARGVGIPARLVTGYRADTRDPQAGLYVVRGTDAHAWVEVYLPGQGWVIVDPTPGDSAAATPPTLLQRALGGGAALRNAGLALGLLALLALGILLAVRLGWLRLPGAGARLRPVTGPRGLIVLHYDQACRLLGRRGIARQPAQTAAEYLSAVAGLAPALGAEAALPALGSLTAHFQRARYSPHTVTPQDVETTRGEVDRLRRALSHTRKKQHQ
jgi:hypothetical protein